MGPARKLWPSVAKFLTKDYNATFGGGQSGGLPVALAEKRLYALGRRATVRGAASTPKVEAADVSGLVLGLDPSGALRLETAAGVLSVWSGSLVADGPGEGEGPR
jgi:hypothetical protein